jgi:hypothetical protein
MVTQSIEPSKKNLPGAMQEMRRQRRVANEHPIDRIGAFGIARDEQYLGAYGGSSLGEMSAGRLA